MEYKELLLELRRCLSTMELTDELPPDTCPADLVHLIDEYLNKQ